MKSLAAAATDLQHTVTAQERGMHAGLWEELAEQAFRWLGGLRRGLYEPKSLHLLLSREALKPLMVTSAPHNQQ